MNRARPALTTEHIMTPEQMARRCELRERKIGVPGIGEIGRYRYAAAYEGLRRRSHPAGIEICFLARGNQTYRVNDRIHRLRGGEQHVVFPGEPHDSAGMPEEKGELYWIFIRLKPARPLLFLDAVASAALRGALLCMPSRHFAAETGARDLLERIIASIRRPDRSHLDRVATASLVLRFLLQTIEASRRNRRAVPSQRIRRSLSYVADHPDELPSVPLLARIVGLSASRFKARFRLEVGLPPREYVLRHKLAVAQSRLSEPGATVTAVAHELGFSSSQYFATVFRRYSGTSPSEHLTARNPY